ncbi:MAG TPA: GNAT family N-acetyltransferase [Solirubrobacteraceae bacterium]|jgi:CelD/BcsL family acetyltransferase involved in cellulose biosynthesis
MGSAEVSPLAIEPLADNGATRARWTELATASTNIFSTWEWAAVWLRHFGAGKELEVTTVRDAGGVITIVLPLVRERRAGFRLTRLVGYGVADQLAPVCAPNDSGAATDALVRASAGRDVLLAERLPSDWPWQRLGGPVISEESNPTISMAAEGSWEDYLEARSSNFRQQVRRRARRLERGLDVRYRLSVEPSRLQADLDVLISLHRARWRGSSRSFEGRREAFHREFAALALQCGWLRLWIAESRGRPVAAWYGFRFGGVESFYQSGRDPRWDQFAVGAGILEHSIRETFNDGLREYRFLRGDEAYKQRYATSTEGLITVAVPQGALGRALIGMTTGLARHRRGRRFISSLIE